MMSIAYPETTTDLKNDGFVNAPVHPFAPILADLEKADEIFDTSLAGYRSPIAPLISHLRNYRGKRLRPALVLLTAEAAGGIIDHHHTLAAAVEMIHTATLVHDDVLDDADTRRHLPTFNAEWGNKISILLGDMLFSKAYYLTSMVDRQACELIGDATNRVCAGELRQVSERGNFKLNESEYFAIIDGKTAALTEVCCRLGALYAGANEEVSQRMGIFGRSLGLAFQIADDVLDLLGDPDQVGKTLGTDLEQQKLTLPLIHSLKTLPPLEAEIFRDQLIANEPSMRSMILETLNRTGSLAYTFAVAEDYANTAKTALNCLPRHECRSILENLAEWSIRREK